ncbi:site-2 protease family protein [Roseisolibacter agri]|uniref:Peptidase M50 n=1 Tax=Roseisolibacter agri TaxID=2014610 RepID=A0AA37V3D0_9BACT|nr:site-2 protease family protein [Roseisolibacter agri]GLC26562.1 peptidase M50 [Roseisolibacter agri]
MDLRTLVLVAPVLLFSMVAHEYAHGYAAYKQGDPTAYQLGRLTWNPLKHIDPFMTVILPVMLAVMGGPIFGGAKPVPVQPRNYRDYKRGDIIVSLAGVATNFVLAFVCALLIVLLGLLGRALPDATSTLALLQEMLRHGIWFNLMLTFFNLLPIPPLDGSHVAKYLLPPAWAIRYVEFGRFGMLILLLFLSMGQGALRAWLSPAVAINRAALQTVAPYVLPVSGL